MSPLHRMNPNKHRERSIADIQAVNDDVNAIPVREYRTDRTYVPVHIQFGTTAFQIPERFHASKKRLTSLLAPGTAVTHYPPFNQSALTLFFHQFTLQYTHYCSVQR